MASGKGEERRARGAGAAQNANVPPGPITGGLAGPFLPLISFLIQRLA